MSRLDPEVRQFLQGLADAYQHALLHSTETSERLTNGIVNKVLEVATRTIPSDGFVSKDYGATIGHVEVFNLGNNDMTVCSGTGGTPPQGGTGVSIVPPGTSRTIHINSRSWTVYGTVGDRVSYQAFTVPAVGRPAINQVQGGTP